MNVTFIHGLQLLSDIPDSCDSGEEIDRRAGVVVTDLEENM